MSQRGIDLGETYYETQAGLYDLVATAPLVRSVRARSVEHLELEPGDTVVDMGCGTGANFESLRSAVGPSGRVVGVDLVEGMLRVARKRIDRAGWENVRVVRGDATQPPLDAADAVLSSFVVGMFESPGPVVNRWIRLVDPGGRITLVNVARTERLVARPLNLLCRAFVRFTAPGYRLGLRSPTAELENRWDAARESLFEGTRDQRDERLAGGFVTLASGRVPGR